MIAPKGFAGLGSVPQRSFGDTGWVTLALQSCVRLLKPAIESGNSHRIANAVRAIAHAPTAEQIDDVVGAACDSMLAEAYALHDSRTVKNVATARDVIKPLLAEMRERSERNALAPALLKETVESYLKIIALLDKRAAQRLEAVGDLAARTAYAMHQSSSTLLEIELAGRLHDIGMLAQVSGGPPRAEQHPIVGEAFLQSVPSLAHLAPIVRAHHERYDGTGYPDGLAGEEIPYAARVISVAAAFVDLITDAPGRDAVLPATACRKLAAGGGTAFDPRIVTALLGLLRYRQRTNRSA